MRSMIFDDLITLLLFISFSFQSQFIVNYLTFVVNIIVCRLCIVKMLHRIFTEKALVVAKRFSARRDECSTIPPIMSVVSLLPVTVALQDNVKSTPLPYMEKSVRSDW